MSDPTTAPELVDIVWRDRDGDHWTFDPDAGGRQWQREVFGCCGGGWTFTDSAWTQPYIDAAWGPLVAVGHLPVWTGPDDDVEPDDVPAVTE